jgi:hypothetical protein
VVLLATPVALAAADTLLWSWAWSIAADHRAFGRLIPGRAQPLEHLADPGFIPHSVRESRRDAVGASPAANCFIGFWDSA